VLAANISDLGPSGAKHKAAENRTLCLSSEDKWIFKSNTKQNSQSIKSQFLSLLDIKNKARQ